MSPILKNGRFSKNATIVDYARGDSVTEGEDGESSFTSGTSRTMQKASPSPIVGEHKPLTNSKFSIAAKKILQNRSASKKEKKFTSAAKQLIL